MDDYFNNDESDDLFNNDDSLFDKIMKQFSKDMNVEDLIETHREKAIRENYNHIKTYGIDVLTVVNHGKENFEKLKYTIDVMLNYFEETEEFEKCAELKGVKTELDKVKF